VKPGERQIHSQFTFSSRDDIVQWIEQNKKPLWAELTFNNLYYVWQGSKITFVAFVKNVEEHLSKTILSTFKSLAKQFGLQHQISFVIIDTNLYKEFSQGLGLKEENIPTFAIFDPFRRKEHFFPKERYPINMKHSKRWIENFLNGKLQDGPEEIYTDEDEVVKITPENFADIVYDQEKDVLVKFYAPWSGQSLALAPIYKKIASLLRLLPTVVVAAMDVHSNQPPVQYNVSVLPTILFFPSKDKDNAIPLTGEHDGIKLVDFILEHQTAATEEDIQQFKEIFLQLAQQQNEQEPPVDGEEETTDETETEEDENKEEL